MVPGGLGFRRLEFWLAIVTTAGVLVFGVLYGVLVAVGLSVLLLLVEGRPAALRCTGPPCRTQRACDYHRLPDAQGGTPVCSSSV